MKGFSATDLGIVSPRLAALKRRGAAGWSMPLAPPCPAPSIEGEAGVTAPTRSVDACSAGGSVLDRPPGPDLPLAPRRRVAMTAPAGTRSHERRWRDASIIVVERRRGAVYKYGSIAVCIALWAQIIWMLRL